MVWKPFATRIFSTEVQPAGSLLSSSFFFLLLFRTSQPEWPTTSPVSHSRVGVLCRHAWGEELHRHCTMGTGPRYRADASTWLHARKPPKKGGIPKALIALTQVIALGVDEIRLGAQAQIFDVRTRHRR